jgi:hypothetical protein
VLANRVLATPAPHPPLKLVAQATARAIMESIQLVLLMLLYKPYHQPAHRAQIVTLAFVSILYATKVFGQGRHAAPTTNASTKLAMEI